MTTAETNDTGTPARRTECGFLFSQDREPHRSTTKELLARFPELRQYLGRKNRWTFLVALAAVAGHLAIAWAVGRLAWWAALLAAFFVGTVFNQCFGAVVHEATHNLIFRGKVGNLLTGILVNAVMFVPSFGSFRKYHLKHHAFQGVYELDADLPGRLEAHLVGNVWWRKLLWLLTYPAWQMIRTLRVREVPFFDRWVLLNWIVVFAVDALVVVYWGWSALLYLAASFWLGYGLSVMGARIIQEHFVFAPPQETYSYYGPANLTGLNVAYHNEHHDFPSAPWHHLPRIRRIAADHYDNLVYHTSYTALLLRFIFDRKISVRDRVERSERGGIALDAEVRPDLDAAGPDAVTP
jgi:sphingolipid delta-4 desaturase